MSATPPPPPGNYTQPTAQAMSPEDQRLWATLTHVISAVVFVISVGFLGWLVALITYLVNKDKGGFIRTHSATAFNFHLTMTLAVIVGSILTLIIIGGLLIFAAFVVVIIFAIIAAIAANKGQQYVYPLSIKFIK